jgi:hypothetical protein
MARLVAILLLILILLPPPPSGATLVVIVPSAGGLVVASDSRTSFAGVTCDGQYKIARLRRPYRTVVAVTGAVAFIPSPAEPRPDPCAALKSAPRLLDIAALVKRYLERQSPDLAHLSLEDLGAQCAAAVERFRQSHPDALQPHPGAELFSVVIAAYDPRSKTSTILNFVVRQGAVIVRQDAAIVRQDAAMVRQDTAIVRENAAADRIEAARFSRIVVTPQDRRGVWAYGEADYLEKHVYAGFARTYLSAATLAFILDKKPVADAPLNQAAAVAHNVIEAASRASSQLPAPSLIGGPIDLVLLGPRRRPQPIHWKAP